MAIPTYCGYEVLRVEREYQVLGDLRHTYSVWFLVCVGDDGQHARVSVSATEADHYGARVPTIEVAPVRA